MIRIIPAVLVKTEKEFLEKLNKIKDLVKWAQIDIMDGKFVPEKTLNKPTLIKKFPKLNFEIHLMVKNPEKYISPWIKAGAKKIVFHIESAAKPEELIKKIKMSEAKAAIAINPETNLKKIIPLLGKVSGVMLMGNTPGKSGQKFQTKTLARAKRLKKIKPNLKLEIDVGVNEKTAPKIIKAGILNLAAGSFIFKNKNPERAIDILKKS